MSISEPWYQLSRYLPGPYMYKNLVTEETTVMDPRHRAFPPGAYKNKRLIDNSAYITAYNQSPQLCTSYFGHLGRTSRTKIRILPSVLRLLYLSSTICLMISGLWIRRLGDLPESTDDDRKGVLSYLGVWEGLIYTPLPLELFAVHGLAIMIMISVGVIWMQTSVDSAHGERKSSKGAEERDEVEEGYIRLQ